VIEETALILNCDGEYADIETKPQSSCGGCESSGVCGAGVFSKVFGNRKTVVRIVNSVGAKPGDQVIIGLQESALSKVSFIFYIVPILSMLLMAILGQEFALKLGYESYDLFAILGGVIGFILGFGLVRLFANKVQGDSRYQPVMLRFATSEKVKFDIEPKLPA
jgi:sigma-E factor negative regulatory protein RseC